MVKNEKLLTDISILALASVSLSRAELLNFVKLWYRALRATFLQNCLEFRPVVQREMPFSSFSSCSHLLNKAKSFVQLWYRALRGTFTCNYMYLKFGRVLALAIVFDGAEKCGQV